MPKNTYIAVAVLVVILAGVWFITKNQAPAAPTPAGTSTAAGSNPAPARIAPRTGGTVPAGGKVVPIATELPSPPAPTVYFRGGYPLDLVEINLSQAYAAAYWPKYFAYIDVYRETSASGPWTMVYQVAGNTYTVKDSGYQTDAHNLYYRVVAVDINGGQSQPSPVSRVIFP